MRTHVAVLLCLAVCSCGTPVPSDVDGGGSGGSGGSGGAGGGAGESAPDTTITSGPTMKLSASASASFAFTSDVGGATFECQWDNEAFAACSSPATKSSFSDGMHRFSVRALNGALSDPSPASAMFDVDAVVPVITVSSKPPATQSNVAANVFVFACSETPCTTECSVDSAPYAACSSPATFDALSAGMHSVSIRGTDGAGNVSAVVSHSWSLTVGWRSVAVTSTAVCGVSGDRRLYCWGADQYGVLGQGSVLSHTAVSAATPLRVGTGNSWASVRAGDSMFCAVTTAGAEHCWGKNGSAQFGDPAISTTTAHTAPTLVARTQHDAAFGSDHACAIDSAGALFCWGEDYEGNLGDGNVASHTVAAPARVGTASWKAVSAGEHTCAIQVDGSLWCFGTNQSGECGQDPVTTALHVPTRVGTESDWASVSASTSFTCALKTSGALYCWGYGVDGRLGTGVAASTHVPTRVGTDVWSSVAALYTGGCGVKRDGTAACWGTNFSGELGSQASVSEALAPVAVAVSEPVKVIVGARSLRCLLTASDALLCWGDNVNSNGGLGRGVRGSEPDMVAVDSGWSQLSLVSNFAGSTAIGGCGLKSGQLWCWGTGRHLAVPGSYSSLHPVRIGSASDWSQVRLTPRATPLTGNGSSQPVIEGHACGVRTNGSLYCWGSNAKGQLGQGNTTDSKEPVLVPAPPSETWRDVAVGSRNTCAITTSGKLFCWGDNSEGQMGDGTNGSNSRLSPAQVGVQSDWAQVDLNGARITGLRAGSLWVWGFGASTVPASFDSATDYAEARSGSNFSCGRKRNGSLSCKTLGLAVTQVGTYSDITQLLNFSDSTCFLRGSGTVVCVNDNGSGYVEAAFPVQPAGNDWASFQFVNSFACGLKASGQRLCKGLRFAGSFGDDFDVRVPAPVVAP